MYNTHWQETHNSTVQIVTVRVCTRSHGTKRGRVSPGVALPVAGSAKGRSASCVLQIKLASLISAFPALSWSWADDKSQLPAVFWSYFLSYVRAGMTSLYGSRGGPGGARPPLKSCPPFYYLHLTRHTVTSGSLLDRHNARVSRSKRLKSASDRRSCL